MVSPEARRSFRAHPLGLEARRLDPDTMPEVFERTDLTPRERLLAAFATPHSAPELMPLCPFIAAAVEIADAEHPARERARDDKVSVAARLTETAREAGAADPELLGEQLALLLDGASARTRTLGTDTLSTASSVAATLIEQAIPAAPRPRAGKKPAGRPSSARRSAAAGA